MSYCEGDKQGEEEARLLELLEDDITIRCNYCMTTGNSLIRLYHDDTNSLFYCEDHKLNHAKSISDNS